MSGYPRNLSYFVRKLNNYSRNTYKLQTLNQSTAKSSQIITFDLPNNSLCDLNTLTWYFEGTTSATTNSCTFPRGIESLIERVEIEINGQSISAGCAGYNHLWNIISDTTLGEDVTNRRKILQNATDVVVPTQNVTTAVPFTITNWLGFLGSCKPEVLDTNLLGNVRIRITLASPSVLVSSATPVVGPEFTLSNMFFSLDTIAIDDGNFYQMHEHFLSGGGVYEIPFNQYFSFSSSAAGDGSLKFSLSPASLNKVWATFVNGATTTPTVLNTNTNTSQYFKRTGAGVTGYQFNINNQPYPNYRPSTDMSFQLMQNAYGLSQDTLGGCYKGLDTLTKWKSDYWVAVQSFTHDAGDDERFQCGIDTRGNVSQGYFEYTGLTATSQTGMVFAQVSSILRVGAGRMIEIVM
jgi:hypothetical protein